MVNNFSTGKELFHSQGTFPYSRNFSLVKKTFHSQGTFPHSRNFYTFKEIFHSCGNFPQSRKFSAKKDQKGSLNAKILYSFNTKSYAKNIFNPLKLILYNVLTESTSI